MKRFLMILSLALIAFVSLSGQETSFAVVLKPHVPDSIELSDELKGILQKKMVQMCTQNGVEAGESKYVIYPEIRVKGAEMTATIPPKCVLELAVIVKVVDSQTDERISQTDFVLKAIESDQDKALYKAISRMNVKTSKIRKFMVVTKDKIEELCK
ncbi:MAG: hypothetical protein IKW65_00835 [Bacteroidales bacterium]|nr:hypothetical protein [Bacteroidales bacterium]